jgi:hypothetical protein
MECSVSVIIWFLKCCRLRPGFGLRPGTPDALLAQSSHKHIDDSRIVAGKLCPVGEKPEKPLGATSMALDPNSAQFYNILIGKPHCDGDYAV